MLNFKTLLSAVASWSQTLFFGAALLQCGGSVVTLNHSGGIRKQEEAAGHRFTPHSCFMYTRDTDQRGHGSAQAAPAQVQHHSWGPTGPPCSQATPRTTEHNNAKLVEC